MKSRRDPLVHLTDVRLVKRLRKGDEVAFRQFFDEFYDRLYRFALPRVGTDADHAEDIVQLTLSKAMRAMKSYRGEAQLQTWLFSICRNTIIDFHRKQGLHDVAVLRADDHPAIRAAVESFRAPPSDEPAFNAQKADLANLVQVALDRLPKNYGDALEWKYIEGRSIKEIGNRLGLGKEATQSLVARAKRSFAEVYASLNDNAAAPIT